jgi:hypothetical protein
VRKITRPLDFVEISSPRVEAVQKVFNARRRSCPRDARRVQPRDPEGENSFQCRATHTRHLWKPPKFQLDSRLLVARRAVDGPPHARSGEWRSDPMETTRTTSRTSARIAEASARLNGLLQLERASLLAYRAAIDAIDDDPMARDTMVSFQADAERHVRELEVAIRSFGGVPADRPSEDIVREPIVFATMRGTREKLRVLKSNEDIVVARYREALSLDAPRDVVERVRRACNDELRHRAWIAARVDAFRLAERRA